MQPGTLAVVLDQRGVGVGVARVLQAQAPGGCAGAELVMAAVETQVGFILMAIESRSIGFEQRRVGQFVFIGCQIRFPQCRLALGGLDWLESLDKRRSFDIPRQGGPRP